jgi:hypothetical protein
MKERTFIWTQELVDEKPDVIIAVTNFGALEVKRATSTIPIVVTVGYDAVGTGRCAVINIGTGTVYWDCQYPTFEACYHLGNILAGNRGFCNLNPWPGPAQVVPYKHSKRHAQY